MEKTTGVLIYYQDHGIIEDKPIGLTQKNSNLVSHGNTYIEREDQSHLKSIEETRDLGSNGLSQKRMRFYEETPSAINHIGNHGINTDIEYRIFTKQIIVLEPRERRKTIKVGVIAHMQTMLTKGILLDLQHTIYPETLGINGKILLSPE